MFEITNHKLLKMKKIFTLLAILFLTLPLIAQNQERLSVHYMDIQSNQYLLLMDIHLK